MYGADSNKETKKKASPKESKDEEDLEAYLRQRNAAIGEETKSLAESKEEKAMKEYMRLRSKTYGESLDFDEKKDKNMKNKVSSETNDIDEYLKQRNKTLGEELTKAEVEDRELQAYLRERKHIMKD